MSDPSNNLPSHLSNGGFNNLFNIIIRHGYTMIPTGGDDIEDISQNNMELFFNRFNFPTGGIINRSFEEDKPKYKNVLSPKGKEQIKFAKYSSEKFKDNSVCPIIQEEFKEGDEIVLLPCNHIFQPAAIMNWLEKENANCPVCRYKLDSVEKIKEKIEHPNFTISNLFNHIRELEEEIEERDIQRAIWASLNND